MAKKKTQGRAPGKAASAKAVKNTIAKSGTKASQTKVALKTTKKKTTFSLHAPDAAKVFAAGCFNDWSPTATPLEKDKESTWTYAVLLEPGEHEYRFVVDDVWWDDPLNRMRRWTEFGCENCILIV